MVLWWTPSQQKPLAASERAAICSTGCLQEAREARDELSEALSVEPAGGGATAAPDRAIIEQRCSYLETKLRTETRKMKLRLSWVWEIHLD